MMRARDSGFCVRAGRVRDAPRDGGRHDARRDAVDRSADERAADQQRRARDRGLHRDADVSRRLDEGRHRSGDVRDRHRLRRVHRAARCTMQTAGKAHGARRWSDKAGDGAGDRARSRTSASIRRCRPNTPDLFTTAPRIRRTAPTIVYPPAGVVMPRNLGDFEVHWTDATPHDIFEISLHTEFADVRAYVPGGNGDRRRRSESVLDGVPRRPSGSPRSATSRRVQLPACAAITEQRTRRRSAPAAPQSVKLTNEEMLGGMYYWAATASTGGAYGIFRHDMSKPGQPAEQLHDRRSDRRSLRRVPRAVARRQGDGDHVRRRRRRGDDGRRRRRRRAARRHGEASGTSERSRPTARSSSRVARRHSSRCATTPTRP